jgi:hypothetical protein
LSTELQGNARILEILEANDGTSTDDIGDLDDEGLLNDLDAEEEGFKMESDELEREMFGLRRAIENEGNREDDSENVRPVKEKELKVQKLEGVDDEDTGYQR